VVNAGTSPERTIDERREVRKKRPEKVTEIAIALRSTGNISVTTQ